MDVYFKVNAELQRHNLRVVYSAGATNRDGCSCHAMRLTKCTP